jgi:GT2 family glycosyltransferase
MKLSVVICSRSGIPNKLANDLKKQTLQPDEVIEILGNSLTTQRNEGIRRASGDLVMFLDDDIELERDYIEQVYATFIAYPDASAVTGKVEVKMFKPNFLHTIFAYIFLLTRRGKGRFLVSGFPETYDRHIISITKSQVLHGCNMTIKKEVFDKVEFNEHLEGGMYGEDDWFSYQVYLNGFVVYFTPFAVCYDNRDYPNGKQEWKIRCTIFNLIKRNIKRKGNLFENIAFWWSLIGFIIMKIVEAIIMRDFSIIKGVFNTIWEIITILLSRKLGRS